MLMQIAANVSKMGPVLVHSFEMERTELETRLISSFVNFPANRIMRGECPTSKLKEAEKEFNSRNLYLCKTTENTLNYVQTSCFEKAKEVGAPLLIIVDYIQIMSSRDRQQRTLEIADCLRGLKTLGQQLGCPVLMGAQLNRECEKRGRQIKLAKGIAEYRPCIADLAESSSIAHDSDVVIFLTRPEQYDGSRPNEADIVCSKNRSGKTFEATFKWSGELCTFYDQYI